jgi:hypothetical protein
MKNNGTAHNRTVTVRRLTAARLRKTPVGLAPFVVFCSATFFCARKNASHFSLSGAKKTSYTAKTLGDIQIGKIRIF